MKTIVHLPDSWSDWTVTDLIGSGSFGTVYRAERKLQDQTLVSAVKVIPVPPEGEKTDAILHEARSNQEAYAYYHEVVEDFEREIRNMDALKGITNVVSIQDYAVEKCTDRVGWLVYLRMEFLKCFTDYQTEHQMTEEDVVRLGIDICTALSYCDQAKILHRDVKPENIFVSKYGNFKLGDFGISRTFERSVGTYTQNGTELYMAPEIVHNEPYGAAADQYSLGLVLYTLMNDNRMPFLSLTDQLPGYRERREALQKRLDGALLPDPKNADSAFSKIILKACAYRPEDRYPDAEAMKKDLVKLKTEREQRSSAETPGEPSPDMPQETSSGNSAPKNTSSRRKPAAAAAILAGTAAACALLFAKVQPGNNSGAAAERASEAGIYVESGNGTEDGQDADEGEKAGSASSAETKNESQAGSADTKNESQAGSAETKNTDGSVPEETEEGDGSAAARSAVSKTEGATANLTSAVTGASSSGTSFGHGRFHNRPSIRNYPALWTVHSAVNWNPAQGLQSSGSQVLPQSSSGASSEISSGHLEGGSSDTDASGGIETVPEMEATSGTEEWADPELQLWLKKCVNRTWKPGRGRHPCRTVRQKQARRPGRSRV